MIDTIGDLVTSKAGRDKGHYFFVYKVIDENYVFVVDGALRTIEKPKKKKLKHLCKVNRASEKFRVMVENKEKMSNADVRKFIMEIISDSRQGEVHPENELEIEEVLDIGQG